jgi:hypothetical protein
VCQCTSILQFFEVSFGEGSRARLGLADGEDLLMAGRDAPLLAGGSQAPPLLNDGSMLDDETFAGTQQSQTAAPSHDRSSSIHAPSAAPLKTLGRGRFDDAAASPARSATS